MPDMEPKSRQNPVGALLLIGAIVGVSAAAFAYTGGWFSPARLSPEKIVNALAPPDGPALGHRRNHAKGICFTGEFISNGAGAALSSATVFETGRYPVVGRFNLGTPMPDAADATVRVRGMGLQIATPNGQVWRSAMINAPFFAVSTPPEFYAFLTASGAKDPSAMQQFIAANPEFLNFVKWAKTGTWTGSFAEERYNSLDSFTFIDSAGNKNIVRWSLIPMAQPQPVAPADLAKLGPDFLETDIAARVGKAPQSWTLAVTVAGPNDPTADPSKVWPNSDKTISVGTLTVQAVEAEADGPCRDINFDPTMLPAGITTSNDPFPAARSAAYAVSYNRRTAEAADYPRTGSGAAP